MARGREAGRSTAIVLFTDLVGSTELRSRLGEDGAEELRRKHDALVGHAIEANRGLVVKSLGDGVMATFTAASDAVAAAVRIHQVIDRHNRTGAGPLEVRIGVSAGDVVFDKGDCFGTPVIEAARLCAAARGGQVLLSDVVRLLAGSAGGHQFASVGALELKGLPALPSFEVAWQPLPAPPLPLPSFLTTMGRIFVGREEQTDELLRLWKEAAAGERRLALVAGEPGVGKTRLAAELATLVHEEGAVVLAGRCDEDLGVPYQPFVEALRHFAGHTPPGRLVDGLGPHGGELTRVLPELAGLVSLPPPLRSDPETELYRLFDAVAGWLSSVSAETPVLLVLDDLHWAAKPTLRLLRHVVRFAEPRRLLVVATYRDSEVGRGHPLSDLLADLRRAEGVERMPLTGLDQVAVAAFVEAAAGHALEDDALARALWSETEGNPFFVGEVLRHLSESGGVEQHDGRWVMTVPVRELGIPEGVRDVVGRRLSRLSERANRLLGVASVVGLEFESTVVATAGGIAEEILLSGLEEAVSARLLSEVADTRYRFAHALVRGTLYEELTAARRVALHRKVAEAIELVHEGALDDYLPALAHHWARAAAPAGETARAVEYATRAGHRALAQLAHDDAVSYYRQALELLDLGPQADEARRCALLIALGEAERRAGDRAHRQTLLDAAALAERLSDPERLVQAALANNRGFYSVLERVDTERVAVLERALDAIGPSPSSPRALLLAQLAQELIFSGQDDRRLELASEALGVARHLDDPSALARVLALRQFALIPYARDERLRDVEELAALVGRLEDPALRFWPLQFAYLAAIEVGDVDEARRYRDAFALIAEDLRQPIFRLMMALVDHTLSRIAGRLEEAEALAYQSYEAGQSAGQRDAFHAFSGLMFWIRYDQGRLEEIVDLLLAALATGRATTMTRAACALTLGELGRPEEARTVLAPLAADGFASLPVNVAWLHTMTMIAEACAAVGDSDWSRPVFEKLEPWADFVSTVVGGGVSGCVHHYLGLLAGSLGHHGVADDHFAAAAAIHGRMNAPGLLARTQLEWARMLIARWEPGNAEAARRLLGGALATARELGFTSVERQAVALVGEAG